MSNIIKTPEWVIAMTDPEYKAWVETGALSPHIAKMREESRRKRADERKARKQKKENAA